MGNTVRIGAFFDGTGNNMWNDRAMNDGSTTNVAKLYDIYEKSGHISLYEEGVGTREYRNGNTFSKEQINEILNGRDKNSFYNTVPLAFGWGVNDISKSMMNQVDEKINTVLKDDPNANIVLDVYGFSRGAAIARSFVNDFNAKYNSNPNINTDFVGVFDTVASVGTKHDLYNAGLNQNLNEGSANQIVHLTAIDERRYNFPLTSMADENGNLASNMKEMALFGVHSDQGGGYPNSFYDTHKIDTGKFTYSNEQDKLNQLSRIREEAKEQGQSIRIIVDMPYYTYGSEFLFNGDNGGTLNYQVEQRIERTNELGKVALHAMYNEAVAHGVPLASIDVLGNDSKIDNNLKDYANAVLNGDDISQYRESVGPYVNVSGIDSLFLKNGDVIKDGLGNKISTINSAERVIYDNSPNEAFMEKRGGAFYYSSEENKDEQLQQLLNEAKEGNYDFKVTTHSEEDNVIVYSMQRVPPRNSNSNSADLNQTNTVETLIENSIINDSNTINNELMEAINATKNNQQNSLLDKVQVELKDLQQLEQNENKNSDANSNIHLAR